MFWYFSFPFTVLQILTNAVRATTATNNVRTESAVTGVRVTVVTDWWTEPNVLVRNHIHGFTGAGRNRRQGGIGDRAE